MRLFAILVLVLLAEAMIGEARMPAVGDDVVIDQSIGIIEQRMIGKVVEINTSLGFMTIECHRLFRRTGFLDWNDMWDTSRSDNVSISLSTISGLRLQNGFRNE